MVDHILDSYCKVWKNNEGALLLRPPEGGGYWLNGLSPIGEENWHKITNFEAIAWLRANGFIIETNSLFPKNFRLFKTND